MAGTISRRTFLTTGAAAAGALLPGVTAYAGRHPSDGVRFTLNAEVLDGGEQVISITLHTARLGPIDPASLTTGTFRVHAKATSPLPIAAGDLIFSEYDLDRPVTAVRLDHWGNIVLDLAYGEGQVGVLARLACLPVASVKAWPTIELCSSPPAIPDTSPFVSERSTSSSRPYPLRCLKVAPCVWPWSESTTISYGRGA